jgi:hypothetical protein
LEETRGMIVIEQVPVEPGKSLAVARDGQWPEPRNGPLALHVLRHMTTTGPPAGIGDLKVVRNQF